LDPDRADHRIVAEFAMLIESEPDLTILTDDTLLALAAQSLGYNPVIIPDGWKLSPEKDERDDQIEQLRTKLKNYEHSVPIVSLNIHGPRGDQTSRLEADVEHFEPSAQELEDAVKAIIAKYPLATDFGVSPTERLAQSWQHASSGSFWKAPTEEEIDTYKSESYPDWIEDVREKLPKIVSELNRASRQIPFEIHIANTGFVNAEEVRVTITGYDDIELVGSPDEDDNEEHQKKISIPAPPKAPRGHFISMADVFGSPYSNPLLSPLDYLRPSPRHDPNRFYFTKAKPSVGVEEVELICDALPHRSDPTILVFRAVIPAGEIGNDPRFRIRLRARNLREPIEKYVRVAARLVQKDFASKVPELRIEA
jgi:hypothetical protein